jgi:hypothetical protein
MMLLLLVLLLGLLEYVRVAGRRNIRASSLEDEVMQLMGAVGFQVGVATCVGCSVYLLHRYATRQAMKAVEYT